MVYQLRLSEVDGLTCKYDDVILTFTSDYITVNGEIIYVDYIQLRNINDSEYYLFTDSLSSHFIQIDEKVYNQIRGEHITRKRNNIIDEILK